MSVHNQMLQVMRQFQLQAEKLGASLQLPPPSLLELQAEYIEVVPGEKLVAKVPFQKRFTNPVGIYQGGFLGAAIDDVFGPLSYMTAERPCMTLSMNISYLKAFTEKMGHVLITGTVLQKTKSFIFMRAEVHTHEGELLAHAETHVTILRDDQMNKVKT